jgi:dTDP-4-amino-4,6-dideoxygalactose transaminase
MIPLFKVFMSTEVLQPVSDILMSGFITQGPKVEEFETALKKYIGNPYLLTLNYFNS